MKASDRRIPYAVDEKNIRSRLSVSSMSTWADEVWLIDNPSFGSHDRSARINWAIELLDGTKLTDPKHLELLETLKYFAWSLFFDPREGLSLKADSIGGLHTGIRYLVRWMAYRGFTSLDELDRSAADLYIEDLVENMYDGDSTDPASAAISFRPDDEEQSSLAFPTSRGGIICRLRIWGQLWRQAGAMSDAGFHSLPEAPFDISIVSLAEQLSDQSKGSIPSLPDEVAIPVLNAAAKFIDFCADDILRLQDLYIDAILSGESAGKSVGTICKAARRAIEGFTFSTPPGESRPWRAPISHMSPRNYRDITRLGDPQTRNMPAAQHLRSLVYDLRDACSIIIQAQVGIRISELCSLEHGSCKHSGLPKCVSIRKSRTGLNEHFYLNGKLSKTVRSPIAVEWLIGSRPAGSGEIPLPIRAILIVDRLFERWRLYGKSERDRNSLFISFYCRRGFPTKVSHVVAADRGSLCDGQNIFIRKYVDLSSLPERSQTGDDLSRYRNENAPPIRTHQWRKSYAQYVFKTDSRMIPAIAQQFHHVSLAMTEQGYISNDPELLDAITSARKQSTAAYFYRFLTDKPALAGRLSKIIRQHIGELEDIASGSQKDVAIRNFEAWVEDKDLRIFFAEHGKCLIRINPAEARCHKISGTSSWLNQQPNYHTREPSVCVGCSCFVVDSDHIEFWERRYKDNISAVEAAKKLGKESEFRVIAERASQAYAVLSAIREKPCISGDADEP